jgi:hypothetical protein
MVNADERISPSYSQEIKYKVLERSFSPLHSSACSSCCCRVGGEGLQFVAKLLPDSLLQHPDAAAFLFPNDEMQFDHTYICNHRDSCEREKEIFLRFAARAETCHRRE